MPIFDSLVKPLIDSATALIGQFHMSPEDKAKAQQDIADLAQKAQQQAQDYEVQLNSIAGQNIRTEEGSGDKYTVRARPSVIWVGLFAIVWDYCLIPTVSMWSGKALPGVLLPPFFWEIWGVVVTGYVMSRSAEKIAAMPGDSQLTGPFGMKIGNKS